MDFFADRNFPAFYFLFGKNQVWIFRIGNRRFDIFNYEKIRKKMTLKIKIIYCSVIFALLAVGLFFKPQFMTFPTEGISDTATLDYRFGVWKIALNCWRDNPITGVGFGNFFYCYNLYYDGTFLTDTDNYDHAHNWYLDILAETGLIGLGFFLLFVYAIFRQVWQMPKKQRLVIIPILAAYGISLGFIFPTWADFTLFLILLGYIVNFNNYEKFETIF